MKLWQKTLLMLFALLALSAGTIFAYAATIWGTTKTTLKTTYVSAGKTGTQSITASQPLTLLLMGVDTGDASRGGSGSWQGNSDSMIVLTLNPKTNTSTMVSMERDTMTNIIDADGNVASSQKLNAAYPSGYNANELSGAASWSMNTVGQQAGIQISNYIAINMNGLVNLVNDVGGIDVYNDPNNWVSTYDNAYPAGTIYISDTEPSYTATIAPGEQHINGEQALVYSRDRHHRANGDYGRIAAQREVITQLMKKLLSMDNVSQYQKFLNDVSSDVRTNIQVNESNLQSLIAYRSCFKKIVSIQYQGIGYTGNDGGSYQLTSEQTFLAVQNAMLDSIGQAKITALNPDLITYESLVGTTPSSGYFLPSATITENGKKTVMGIDPDGNFVKVTAGNAGNYISTSGDAVTADSSSSSSSSSTSSSSS